ncbi:MAG TPA: NPCBM/NEW2 domain-containing protein [Verrucomicrobiales bacterium]|nr:NPCBM/NEW2 domain-containing protein [Verrucomicrobiales bacterium]
MNPSLRFLFPWLATVIASNVITAEAATKHYRLMWKEDPATTMVVGWTQAGGILPAVHYGEEDFGEDWERYPLQAEPEHVTKHLDLDHCFVRLRGLKPATAYFFVVRDSDGVSERRWFRTAAMDDRPFAFLGGGDSRNNQEARQNANRIVARLRPLFVAFGGDYTASSTKEEWEQWFEDWQLTVAEDGLMIPIVPARGNHEKAHDVHRLFDTLIPEDYFALDFAGGNFRLYTLNSNIPRGGGQARWLEKDLEQHRNIRWKMAQYHHPFRPHTSGKAEQTLQYQAWAHLFYGHGLNLALECDSHTVKRTWPVRPFRGKGSDEGFIRDDRFGIVFIGEGCWGAPLRSNDDDKEWTRASGQFNQVGWIVVKPDAMTIRTVQVDNAQEVGSVTDDDPFSESPGLALWRPESGAEIVLSPKALPGSALAKVTALEVRQPEISIDPPVVLGRSKVEIRSEEIGGEIRYTLDGSAPGPQAHLYEAPFEVEGDVTVRVALFRDGELFSHVTHARAVAHPPLNPEPPRPEEALAEFRPVSAEGPRRESGRRFERRNVRLRGEDAGNGMLTKAGVRLEYALDPSLGRFVAVVGLPDSAARAGKGAVSAEVLVDGKLFYRTPVLSPWQIDRINVPLPETAKRMTVIIKSVGEPSEHDEMVWAHSGFTKT